MYIPVRSRMCSREDRVLIFDSSYTAAFAGVFATVFAAALAGVFASVFVAAHAEAYAFVAAGLAVFTDAASFAALSAPAREASPLPVPVLPPPCGTPELFFVDVAFAIFVIPDLLFS
jgi:hypothetical protein